MLWNLNFLYPLEEAEHLWKRDHQQAQLLWKQGNIAEAEELQSFLWSYAYARYALDTREIVWNRRADEAEMLFSDESTEEVDETANYTLYTDAKNQYETLITAFKEKRFNGMTLFQAMNTDRDDIRRQTYADVNRYVREHLNEFTRLLLILVKEPIQLNSNFMTAKRKLESHLPWFQNYFLQMCKKQHTRQLEWHQLFLRPADDTFQVKDLQEALDMITGLYAKYENEWAWQLEELIGQERIDASDQPHKLQAAFTMPVAYHQLPLCFIHSFQDKKSLDGLVHETAHGIHYALNRHQHENFLVPDPSVEEIFPTAIELLGKREWESEERYTNRLVQLTFQQFLYVQFRYNLSLAEVKSFQDVQKIWTDTCCTLFGGDLIKNNETNYTWLLNRLFWVPHEYGQSYVCGSVGAWNLADKIYEGDPGLAKRLTDALKTSPSQTIEEWNRKMGFDLYAGF
jgi:oligoendopeptidase F